MDDEYPSEIMEIDLNIKESFFYFNGAILNNIGSRSNVLNIKLPNGSTITFIPEFSFMITAQNEEFHLTQHQVPFIKMERNTKENPYILKFTNISNNTTISNFFKHF